VANRVLDVMRQPYDMNREIGRELWVTVSIGVASGARESADDLLHDADLALYEAKVAGKNRQVVFREEMQRAARDRLTFQIDLAEALPRGELFLDYQPIYALESEQMVGVEALIRWNHPSRGVVSPLEFIPIAEESGLIVPIGRWVLEQATEQVAAWRRQGHDLGAWVNVSARQLDQAELIGDVHRALDDSGLDPGALVIEVTETALTRDTDATATGLLALKRLGVRIAIDDFGTGYSSLGHLRQFPADILKIDRSFMGGVNDTKESAALIHTIIQLGEALGIDTLAEGIEEQVQLETLRSENCRYGQGFLLSRPVQPAVVERLLNASPAAGGEAFRRAAHLARIA
jgi:EAL domain-containing protein (putative c-di-GMP-specific phosphodiesterase class I)